MKTLRISNGWLKDSPLYIGVYTFAGFLPIACSNCKQKVLIKDAANNPVTGYISHKKCLPLTKEALIDSSR